MILDSFDVAPFQRKPGDLEKATQALRESELRYRALVNAAHDAIISADDAGLIALWNPAAQETFGFSSEEILGEPISILLAFPDQEADFLERVTWAMVVDPWENTPPLSLKGRRKDGASFPMEVSFTPWGRSGEPLVNVVIRDVSGREESQGALEQLSQRYEALLESAGDGILGIDAKGFVSYANPAALKLLAFEAEEILGEPAHARLHVGGGPEAHSEEECPILSSIREGTRWKGEDLIFRKDGSPLLILGSCMPQVGAGEEGGGVLVFEDITDRKEKEEALRSSEERYRSLVENAVYGIYTSTPDGWFLSANPALAKMLGYGSVEELMTVNIVRDLYVSLEDRRRLLKKVEGKGRLDGLEVDWRRKDGTLARIRLSGRSHFSPDGTLELYEVIAEDLSFRKTLEDQLRQAQKMEAVGQLTGGIAHDFNNVLAVILLNSEITTNALQKGESVDPADITAIHDAAKRASGITRKLLGFSRQGELKTSPVELKKVVGNLASMLRTAVPEFIDLRIQMETEIPSVAVDETAVEQSILNLVTNARDAMPNGGVLTVTLKEALLDEEYCAERADVQPGLYSCIEVADTGIGMDPETQRRVFEPFFTTKDSGTGTGLGMAMVYGLTKQQGGHVGLYSEKGEGTTIRLYFPALVGGNEAPALTVSPEDFPGGSETLLVVEDQADLRATAKRVFQRQGYTVLTASNGREALEVLEGSAAGVALVFSDLVMPVMGGVELFQALGKLGYSGKFLLASGYTGEEGRNGAMKDIPYIQKPWLLTDLLRAVRGALDGETEKESTYGSHTDHR